MIASLSFHNPHRLTPPFRAAVSRGGRSLLLLLLLFCISCAGARERRLDAESIEAEHTEAEERLAQTPTADALLAIAQYQDARTGTVEIAHWTRHPDPVVRASAYRALGLVGGPIAAARLAGGLDDLDREVQSAAAFGLSLSWSWPLAKLHARQLQEEHAILLDALLDSGSSRSRLAARSELALAETPEWSDRLGVDGGSAELFAAFALLCRNRKLVGEPLPQMPELSDQALKNGGFDATYAVAQCGPNPEQKADLKLLEELDAQSGGADEDRAVWALRALGHFNAEVALPVLRRALESPSSVRRSVAALRGLGRLGSSGLPLIVESVGASEAVVAGEAADLLGRTKSRQAWNALVEELSTPAAVERPQAVRQMNALAQLSQETPFRTAQSKDSEPEDRLDEEVSSLSGGVLEQALQSSQLTVRRAALSLSVSLAVAAGRLDETRELLVGADRSDDPAAAVLATLALAGREEELVEGPLLEQLASDKPLVVAIAVGALGEREGAHITQRLIELYDQSSATELWEVREALASAILGREGVPADLIFRMRDDKNAHVRMAVYRFAIQEEERTDLGPPPQERPLPTLTDHRFGVGNVQSATVETSRGSMEFLLFPDLAPGAVANFVALAERGFYEGILFHRVVPDFVVQAGDPLGTGWGGPGHTIRDEFSDRPYLRGSLGMARSQPDTAGSQWFVTHSRQPHLDRHYTLFGQMVTGWTVLDELSVGDQIKGITIHRKSPQK